MKEFLLKIPYTLDNDYYHLTFLMSAKIGFNFSDYLDKLPNVINEDTEVLASCTAYMKNGCHGGYFPQEVYNISDGWVKVSEFLGQINSLATNDNIGLNNLNKALIKGMLIHAERVNLKDKIDILERALSNL